MIRMHLGMPLLSFVAEKKGAKAPAIPDPNVVSQAQTTSNQQTAAYQNAIDHGNVTTPFGTQTNVGRVDPTTGATVYDQNISVSPQVQQLIDKQAQNDLALGNTSSKMLNTIDQTYSQPLDTSSLPKLLGADDLQGQRQAVSDALYKRQTAYLDPQFEAAQKAQDAKLANQGITLGSEAYKNAQDDAARAREFAYGQARDSAIAGGLNETTQLANLSASQRQQMLAEALTKRAQPINEYSALQSNSQVNVPQFQNPNTAQVAPTDVSGNIWNAVNGNLGIYNSKTGSANSLLSGLMGLGGQLGSSWIQYSDARVKSKVKRIGLLPQGVGVYEYEYTGDPQHEKQVGVMAQEVERNDPGAVTTDAEGVKRVDYSRVLSRALAESYDAAA
jgi:hypothetical protein